MLRLILCFCCFQVHNFKPPRDDYLDEMDSVEIWQKNKYFLNLIKENINTDLTAVNANIDFNELKFEHRVTC